MSHTNVSWKYTKDVNYYNIYTILSCNEIVMVPASLRANSSKIKLTVHCTSNLREAKGSAAFLTPIPALNMQQAREWGRVTLEMKLHNEV